MAEITAHSGLMVDPLNLRAEDILIEDICWHLSNQCRFSGAVDEHYSVGQHSCLVSDLVSAPVKFDGLMHDASEGYLQDVARPLKEDHYFGQAYRGAEGRAQRMISQVFNLAWPIPDEVKEVDMRLCLTERRDLITNHVPGTWSPEWEALVPYPLIIKAWTPPRTRREFMARFEKLRRDK